MGPPPTWNHSFAIEREWDGASLHSSERCTVDVRRSSDALEIQIEAPLYGDPPPPGAPGPTDGLWDYEVVELFLLAEDGTYFEFELGPAGHWLALQLGAVRQPAACPLPSRIEVSRSASRWSGAATFTLDSFTAPFVAGNACAIHGVADQRRYASCVPLPGEQPDFHQPGCFQPLGP